MKKTDCVILERTDVRRDHKNLPIEEISHSSFVFDGFMDIFRSSEIILFVDEDMQTKIIKNRFGKLKTN